MPLEGEPLEIPMIAVDGLDVDSGRDEGSRSVRQPAGAAQYRCAPVGGTGRVCVELTATILK